MNRALFFLLLSLFLSSCSAQTCNSFITFSNNAVYASCNDLPVLNSYLYWNYNQTTRTVDLVYRHTGVTNTNWVAWAINPSGARMVGSQALVAFQNSSGQMRAYTSPVTQTTTTLLEGPLSFGVSGISGVYQSGSIFIFAKLELPASMGTAVTQVWQVGPVSSDTPQIHALSGDNVRSMGTVDFLSGVTTAGGGSTVSPRQRKRNIHGVLNAVSWGTLLPLGAMIARYLKVFKSADPTWFYLHIACQVSAYAVGVAGWATGLKLGSDSPGIVHNPHRNLGIALFCLGTLQVFALLLRPKKDHKYRLYWNIYHHTVGYVVIIMSIVNIFEGFDILDPAKKWKKIYIGILIFLGVNAALLEAYTWFVVIKMKKIAAAKLAHANGANGHGARTQPQAV